MKIKALITGSTGMVGKGVLLQCLDNKDVESVLVVNRRPLNIKHPKLKEILLNDFFNLNPIREELMGYNACFFCLGASAFRMSEADYNRITHDLTLGFAKILLDLNAETTFCYVSGQGTDSSEKGRIMWARVKGKTENNLLEMPFKATYMFRPGFIQPMNGIKSSTKLYNTLYSIFKPIYPVLKRLVPNGVTSTTQVGNAMINAAIQGYDKTILSNKDINVLAGL
jgi:hypothetical protein